MGMLVGVGKWAILGCYLGDDLASILADGWIRLVEALKCYLYTLASSLVDTLASA